MACSLRDVVGGRGRFRWVSSIRAAQVKVFLSVSHVLTMCLCVKTNEPGSPTDSGSASLRPTKNQSETWSMLGSHLDIHLTPLQCRGATEDFYFLLTHTFSCFYCLGGEKTLWISSSAHFYDSSHPGDSFPLFLCLILSSKWRIWVFYLPFLQFVSCMRTGVCSLLNEVLALLMRLSLQQLVRSLS